LVISNELPIFALSISIMVTVYSWKTEQPSKEMLSSRLDNPKEVLIFMILK